MLLILNGVSAQECPLDDYISEVYENPLFADYLSSYDVKFYHLSLEVSNTTTYIEGFARIDIEAVEDLDTIVFQLISPMNVLSIEVNDVEVSNFVHKDDAIYIKHQADKDDFLKIKISYNGVAGQDRGFFAGMTSAYESDVQEYVTYTLSEPFNARDWFPVKQVLTDKADSVWVDLICDKDLMAGSNGLLEEIESVSSTKHKFKWRSNYPIDFYLISLSVANYRDYSFYAKLSNDVDSVLVQNYIYDNDDYFSYWKSSIDETADMINLYSKLLGDYPFADEKYGHCVAPMGGGMEHQTMTTLDNFGFGLVAHELAHMWFGDDVTCGTWQDIWINEGFASYMEYVCLQNLRTQADADSWLQSAQYLAMDGDGTVYVPIEEADDIYRIFSYEMSYKKGATLLHMIRYELDDDDLFFNVLKTYRAAYGDSTATAVDFREVLEEESGRDFSCFFDQWYYGSGYPSFRINSHQEGDTVYLESKQTTSSSRTTLFKTHFDVELVYANSSEIVRLYQDQNVQNFKIPVSEEVVSVVFDPKKNLLAGGLANISTASDKPFTFGPNPFFGTLHLRFNKHADYKEASVFTIDGRLIKQEEIDTNPFEFDLQSLDNGTYVLVLQGDRLTYKEKIVKGKSL